ncbi:MAG: hypothetical protein LBN93_02450 [Candidatus Symbiothrix sp.]|jgi:hypothetical protein|nr:hypothetical protein [Candidatus Symbiothrix sp.]
MSIEYFTIQYQTKAKSLMSNSTGQRPVYWMMLFNLRPERAVAIKDTLTPFQGYDWMRTSQHRALPCAIAKRALPLIDNDWANRKLS